MANPVKELKERCLKSIAREKQLEQAEHLAGNLALENYHSGRKQVWLEVHSELVVRFKESE